ncbi:hypothetical protein Tco_1068147 [Tanacetum coccineum]|uniref:Uncharacterized protein n=1 Tax=Tanacetum coccineum TaxID=301880 RepID=A0ABQ5HGT1_9ASTR
MMGIPNEHQLKFNSIKDAKKLLEAIEKRFGGNAATKKTQRNLLKQQYENITSPSSEMLDQTFDRLQKLVSQLELLDENLSQEDVNQKLLRSLSPKWNTHDVVWRNKADLDTMSMDDLYNNLKVYEPDVKGMSSSSSSTQNMTFVSSSNKNTSSTNGVVNTAQAVNIAHGVSTASTQVNVVNSTNIDNLSDDVICAFFASQPNSPQLVHEARRFLKNTGRKLTVNGNEIIGEITIKELRKKLEIAQKEKDGIQLNVDKFEHASKISPPYTGNFMPPTPYLSFTGLDEFVNEPVFENSKAMSSKEEPKVVRKNDDAPIIKEWVSNDEEGDVSHPKTKKKIVRPSIVKKEFVKSKQQ